MTVEQMDEVAVYVAYLQAFATAMSGAFPTTHHAQADRAAGAALGWEDGKSDKPEVRSKREILASVARLLGT